MKLLCRAAGLLEFRETPHRSDSSRGDEQAILSYRGVALATSREEKLADHLTGESEGAGILGDFSSCTVQIQVH